MGTGIAGSASAVRQRGRVVGASGRGRLGRHPARQRPQGSARLHLAFEALVARGRRVPAAGDAEEAAIALGEALALWRGPALADVADMPFARAEAARLEEAR